MSAESHESHRRNCTLPSGVAGAPAGWRLHRPDRLRPLGALDGSGWEDRELARHLLGSGLPPTAWGTAGSSTLRRAGGRGFRQDFRRLYVAMRDEAHEAGSAGLERDTCYVRSALAADAPPSSVGLAAPVIDRWCGWPSE